MPNCYRCDAFINTASPDWECPVCAYGRIPAGYRHASEAREANLDAAQRELDRRAAEGEDVSGLHVNQQTGAIEAIT